MGATINDVARVAGVSKGTVSKFLNGGHYVSMDNKSKIAAAIEELGFEPNRIAQGLSLPRACVTVIYVSRQLIVQGH